MNCWVDEIEQDFIYHALVAFCLAHKVFYQTYILNVSNNNKQFKSLKLSFFEGSLNYAPHPGSPLTRTYWFITYIFFVLKSHETECNLKLYISISDYCWKTLHVEMWREYFVFLSWRQKYIFIEKNLTFRFCHYVIRGQP